MEKKRDWRNNVIRRRYVLAMGWLVGLGLLTGGCVQKRIPLDYEIQIGNGFGYEFRNETGTFRGGERFRLRLTTHADGYAYVLSQGMGGRFTVLFPDPRIGGGSNRVKGWDCIYVPPVSDRQGAYMFSAEPGVETVIVIISDVPVTVLDAVVHGSETDPTRITQILHRLDADGKRDGSFEKIHHRDHTQVILESPNKDAVLVNTIRLNHVASDTQEK
jgi:hypothetical protein